MSVRNNIVLKKAARYSASVPRFVNRLLASQEAYAQRPPVLVNSFPKSGTHLLLQVLSALPEYRDWGGFWASQPSFTFREIAANSMAARVSRVAPAELVCGHLYYSDEVAEALRKRNVVHFFIYRDPRDVVISEAHYLAKMNRWHRLHSRFRSLPSQADRVKLSIMGLSDSRKLYYPNIAQRFSRFEKWLDSGDVCAVSYEELVSSGREDAIRRIFDFYRLRANCEVDVELLVEQAIKAIQPTKSHTFRKGGSGGWKGEFDADIKTAFKENGGELVLKLGYERSWEW